MKKYYHMMEFSHHNKLIKVKNPARAHKVEENHPRRVKRTTHSPFKTKDEIMLGKRGMMASNACSECPAVL